MKCCTSCWKSICVFEIHLLLLYFFVNRYFFLSSLPPYVRYVSVTFSGIYMLRFSAKELNFCDFFCILTGFLFYQDLSYGGVQSLLGLTNTKGTIEDALPPPQSALLSSFLLPYNINVRCLA